MPEELDALRARLTDREARLSTASANVTRLSGILATRQATQVTLSARRDILAERLANLSSNATPERRADLTARIATLTARVAQLDAVITDISARLATNTTRQAELTEVITRLRGLSR